MPKVSVIIPTYNRAKFVCEAVESVLAQTYKDYEIIVIDDGSTDNTKEALKAYNGKIRYFRQDNQGISKARNFAVSQSQGEYLAFLDDDDLWLPERLEKQIPLLDQNPDCAFICSEMYAINKDGETIKHFKKGSKDVDNFESLLDHNFVPILSVLMRKDCFYAVGGFDENLHSTQDYDLWLRLARRYGFHQIPEPLVKWRLYDGNIHKQNKLKVHDYTKIYSKKELVDHLGFWARRKLLAKSYHRYGCLFHNDGDYLRASWAFAMAVFYYPLVGLLYWPQESENMRFSVIYRILRIYWMIVYYFIKGLFSRNSKS